MPDTYQLAEEPHSADYAADAPPRCPEDWVVDRSQTFKATKRLREQHSDSDLNSEVGKGLGPRLRPIDSDSWLGTNSYETDDEHNVKVIKFFNTVKWDLLASIASKHRSGVQCTYSPKSSIESGCLLARLLPPSDDSWRAFEVEIASMKFSKLKSKIPVPEVFAYNIDPANDFGRPYMLIKYLHGTTASELRRTKDSEPSTYGNFDQDRKFREQMARIQAEAYSFKFDKIGSLYYSEKLSSFFIDPELDTGKGPWASSTEHHYDLTTELLKRMAARCHERTPESASFALPVLLNHLMSIYSEERNGPFRLVNRDFGAHNILVDNDFNIVGVVDFDGVMAAPLEAAAQYPVFSCMEVEAPAYVESNPYALERIERTKPQLARYKEWLIKYEAELGYGSTLVGRRVMSTSALIYQGMLRNSRLLRSENETWFASALKMLRDYAEASEAPNLAPPFSISHHR